MHKNARATLKSRRGQRGLACHQCQRTETICKLHTYMPGKVLHRHRVSSRHLRPQGAVDIEEQRQSSRREGEIDLRAGL